ncbi:mobilization protein [Bacteroidia bacterium]|nr:mobilization protein [Bacteroidia bacterium]
MARTIKNPNKNGRPPKDIAEKKRQKITVKMTMEEYSAFKFKAHLANMTVSEYIRRLIRSSKVQQRLSSEHLGYVRQISGMANNLNQIAKRANTTGYSETHQDCRTTIIQLDNLVKRITE